MGPVVGPCCHYTLQCSNRSPSSPYWALSCPTIGLGLTPFYCLSNHSTKVLATKEVGNLKRTRMYSSIYFKKRRRWSTLPSFVASWGTFGFFCLRETNIGHGLDPTHGWASPEIGIEGGPTEKHTEKCVGDTNSRDKIPTVGEAPLWCRTYENSTDGAW